MRRGSACLIAVLLISAGVSGLPARGQSAPDDPGFEFQWGFPQIGVQDAWAVGRGAGVKVAVLDTGVDLRHEDLDGQLLTGGWDFVDRDAVAQDHHGQGTHVAGIVAAATGNAIGVAGVAPQAKILPVRVLHDDADGFEHNIVDGLRFAIEKRVDVLVLDLGANVVMLERATFRDVLGEAWRAGIIPVLSADHFMVREAGFAEVPALVVGGLTRDGAAGPYNRGVGSAMWGISAPGGKDDGTESDIFSAYWAHRASDGRDFGNYVYDSGNIQAAAHVAGVAAILRGLGQTPEETVERILSSATDQGPTGRDRTYGAGALHAGRSVRGIPAQPAGSTSGGSPTSAPPSGEAGGGAPASGGGTGPEVRPGRTGPRGPAGPAPATAQQETPAGAAEPGDPSPAALDEAAGEAGDIVGGLAANQDPDHMPGRTPLLPLVAFLLLIGSATITWALRHRTPEPLPPINSAP